MQYSSTLVGHLVWPAVVIVAIVLFRREIATKILELKSLRSKLVGAEFEDAKGSIDSAIDEAKSAPKIHERSVTAGQIAGVQVRAEGEDDSSDAPFEVKDQEFDSAMIAQPDMTSDDEWSEIEKYLSVDPRYSVRRAGTRLDQSVLRLATPYGLPPSALFAARKLTDANVIPSELGAAIVNLMRLRDRTQGSLDFRVTPTDASNFVAASRKACAFLDSLPLGSSSTLTS